MSRREKYSYGVGVAISQITFEIERIDKEYIDSKCSLESPLQVTHICSVRIFIILKVTSKIPIPLYDPEAPTKKDSRDFRSIIRAELGVTDEVIDSIDFDSAVKEILQNIDKPKDEQEDPRLAKRTVSFFFFNFKRKKNR